jgi:hypothetical protein
MGLLDKFKKGGGGFLNGVDGVIVDYQFTDSPDFGGAGASAPRGTFASFFCALTVRQDGSDADETTHLFVGSAEDFVISEDGHELQPVENAALWGNTAFAGFYESLVTHGLEDIDPEEGAALNFTHMIGARCRFIQVKDEQAMERAKKNARSSRGKINEQGQKKGKDGKYYDIRTLQVSAVHSTGDAPASKPNGKPAAKASGKPALAAANRLAEKAQATLVAILEAEKGNSLSKSKLNVAVTRALQKDKDRDEVRKLLYDDETLDTLVDAGVIEYDKSSKQQTISLA